MSDIICVTDRSLCGDNFLKRIERVAQCHPAAILLREKDLRPDEYEALAGQVAALCRSHGVPCILHTHVDAALRLGIGAVHLPLPVFRTVSETQKQRLRAIGVSCHSVQEAREAVQLGCTYLIAGHVFETDCKEGLPGRGLSFLRAVCAAVDVPVCAIGGINAANAAQVRRAGAAGLCIRSGIMQCGDVESYLDALQETEERTDAADGI